mmetsp:Transcript_27893/g.64826  ORF Transcript_27893/g.64826 Transcript_27893/m.64826 type:complete len:240 (-) Transcript_27893:531-1250(-)
MGHLDHRCTFAIGDGIKNLLHLLRMVDGDLDGVRAAQAVKAHGSGLRVRGKLVPHCEVGENLVGRIVFTPRSEALVEPQVIPPRHGYEIPEPLVCQLVSHNDAHPLHLVPGSSLSDEEVHLPVRDQAPIFHGPSRKLRDGNHVKLRQRVRDAEVVIIAVQGLRGHLQRKLAILHSAWRRKHPHQHAMLGLRLNEVEFTDHKGQEVGGHLRRIHETDLHLRTGVDEAPAFFGHVAQSRQA